MVQLFLFFSKVSCHSLFKLFLKCNRCFYHCSFVGSKCTEILNQCLRVLGCTPCPWRIESILTRCEIKFQKRFLQSVWEGSAASLQLSNTLLVEMINALCKIQCPFNRENAYQSVRTEYEVTSAGWPEMRPKRNSGSWLFVWQCFLSCPMNFGGHTVHGCLKCPRPPCTII